KCKRTVYVRTRSASGSGDGANEYGHGGGASVTTAEVNPRAPDAPTHFRPPSCTHDECRRNQSGLAGFVITCTRGDGPPARGYSSHNVPSGARRLPGAPKLIPSRRMTPVGSAWPK